MTSVSVDWAEFRRLSLQPDGFGSERRKIWPQLLHVDLAAEPEAPDEAAADTSSSAHPDEHQISLDTDRSFVLYPVEDESLPNTDRAVLQRSLNTLIVALFRKRPKLSYFQGFHDIITVLFLTLLEHAQLPCAEAMSLQRLRDAMGQTLEPVVGLLYVLKKLIRLMDPEFATAIEESSPIPYFALSNLLTLFSHDMPTLPLIQHVFDFLLCRPPIAAVYLAAAIVRSRKPEVLRLQAQDEDGVVHSLLSGLPDIYDMKRPDLHDDEPNMDQQTKLHNTSEEVAPKPAGEILSLDPEPKPEQDTVEEKESKVEAGSEPSQVTEAHSDTPLTAKAASEAASLAAELNSVPLYMPPDPSLRAPPRAGLQPPRVSLLALLAHADYLMAEFPPTTPALCVAEIFGPHSVVMTWAEDAAALPGPDAAEAMVAQPALVALGYAEPPPTPPPEPEMANDETEKVPEKPAQRRKRRRLRKRGMTMERGLVLATAVLVVGAALAYGARGSFTARERSEWRKLGRWIGGGIFGTGQRVLEGLVGLP